MDRHTGIVGLLLVILGGFLPGAGPAVADCPSARVTPLAELRAGRVAEGRHVTTEGIVTGVFTGADRLGGFFLQDGDTHPVGLFVYAPALEGRAPKPGDRVQVAGRFARFHERPQVSRITDLNVCAHVGLPGPVELRLPQDAARLADLQDVKVRLDQTLTVTGNAQLGRYGSLHLAAGGRLFRPGQGAVQHRDSHMAAIARTRDPSLTSMPRERGGWMTRSRG
jgi:uncharacterized protein